MASSSSGCSPAASAAPTSTWWTATCLSRSSRSCPGTRSSARWSAAGPRPRDSSRASAWAFHGSVGPAASAAICASGRENLCERGLFTGYTKDGGYADALVADARYAFRLPDGDPVGQAPLLCAGLIGYRALRLCGDAERIGLFGFGGSAHIVCQVAAHQGRRVFAVTRRGEEKREFARDLGAEWAGPADDLPEELDAAIVFAPAGEVVVDALRALGRGGSVVCAGIHMSDIPPIAYEDLWHERQIRSVANLTRRDGDDFLPLAAEIPVRTRTTTFGLEQANDALAALRDGKVEGAAVLEVVREGSK